MKCFEAFAPRDSGSQTRIPGQGSSKEIVLFIDGKEIDYHDLRKLYTMIEKQNKYCFINAEEEC